ncbi:MAG: hypothetical protein QM729_13250 [Solirubrobacterales bacterium]
MHARQSEEIAAAERLDVFLQQLAVSRFCTAMNPRLEIGLIDDEQQAHIELVRPCVTPFE